MRSSASAGSPPGSQIGVVAGRYELVRPLARGGMGEVFLARDLSTGDDIALKRVRDEQLRRPKVLAHFRAEYHVLSRMRHPRIIQVHEFGVWDGVPFYTMELLDGQDLRDVGPVPYREACGYLRDVASSLALLHAQRVLHRDLSPRNVRRTSDGRCKLIDFGAMTPFGVPPNVAGTAPFVPPEAAECGFLDQRADLYSLGALAYWLLTGEHAYRAKKLDDLPALWPSPIDRVRTRVPDVPEDLDALVMSLLELDALKRPSSAADVIERLSAIGRLEPEDTLEVEQGYLSSSNVHGRDQEVGRLRGLVERSLRGEGAALWIEGGAGIGKSRLLHEASVLAQTRGMLTLRGFGSSEQGESQLARQLWRALLRAAPESTGAAHRQLPSSQQDLPLLEAFAAPANDNLRGFEERAVEQARLSEGFTRVALERPLLLVIDDFDQADEFSAALVASLAHQARGLRMLVVASINSEREPVARDALATFRGHADRVRLAALDAISIRDMVSGILGDVPNLERLVDWLDRGARGNPGLTMELMQLLVARGVLRYVGGTWVLPEGAITERMPQGLAETLALRLGPLSSMARHLAEIAAVMGRDMPLELCLLVSGASNEATLSALDELVAAGVFVGAAGGFTFAQGALREAIQQTLGAERTREIHAALARALLALPPTLERRLEAGAHLVRTDDELKGADLLAVVGPELIQQGRSLGVALPALERALEVYERRGAPQSKSLPLRQILVLSGYLFDYRLALRHGEQTLTKLAYLTGLPWARRLTRFVGARLALLLAIVIAFLRKPFLASTRRAPGPYAALNMFGRAVMGMMGVRATSLDVAGTRWVLEQMAPLAPLPIGAMQAAHLACKAFALQPQGREAELRSAVAEALRALEGPLPLSLSEVERMDLRVGLLLAGGINECYRLGSQALAQADQLERLGTRLSQAAAHRVRMTYHLVRGERERTEHYRRLIDVQGIQGSTTWQVEWFAVPIEGLACIRYGDLVGARRALSRLEVLAAELPSLSPLRDMVRLGYHARRGDYELACTLGDRFMEAHAPRSVIGWGSAYANIACTHNRIGQYQRALEVCERALSALSEADREFIVMYAPIELEHATALAGLGRVAEAKQLLHVWGAKLRAGGELAALVLLHEGQIILASMLEDKAWLRAALVELRETAEQTRSTSLIAFAARVAQAHVRKSRTSFPAPRADSEPGPEYDAATTVDGSVNTRTRLRALISELRSSASAESAFVFVEGSELAQACSGESELSEDLRHAIQAYLRVRPASGIAPAGSQASLEDAAFEAAKAGGFVFRLLPVSDGAPRALVVLRRPLAASTEYETLFTELTEALPLDRERTFAD